MSPQRYDKLTLTLHWVIAVLVVAVYAVGLVREGLPKGDVRAFLLTAHMSVGLAIVALMAVRAFWRPMAPKLEPVPMPAMMELAAKAGHLALYGLLFALPLIGLAAAWIKGRNVGFFGLPLPSPFAVDKNLAHTLEEVHEVVAHGLMALVGVHAAAAIYHHHVLKDGVLARMLPRLARQNA